VRAPSPREGTAYGKAPAALSVAGADEGVRRWPIHGSRTTWPPSSSLRGCAAAGRGASRPHISQGSTARAMGTARPSGTAGASGGRRPRRAVAAPAAGRGVLAGAARQPWAPPLVLPERRGVSRGRRTPCCAAAPPQGVAPRAPYRHGGAASQGTATAPPGTAGVSPAAPSLS
jgi:hypothetical protein